MFNILTPSRIIVGPGSVASLKEIITSWGADRILIITDQGIRESGILERIVTESGREDGGYDIFDRVLPNPDIAVMEACGHIAETGDFDMVVGLGGGSPMDVAKAASVLPANGGKIKPLLGRGMLKRSGIPLCLVPTTAGTGSEATQAIVVDDPESRAKVAIWDPHVLPKAAIVDPELTAGMPPSLTADTGLDALIHGIEAYASKTSNPVARLYARKSIRLVSKHLLRAVRDGGDMEARSGMALAALLGGLAISNGGLGAIHALAYPLDTVKHIPHGRTVAIMAPWVLNFNLKGNENLYSDIARFLGEEVDRLNSHTAGEKSIQRLIKLMESVGVSPYLEDHGIQPAETEILAKEAYRVGQRLLPHNPRTMNEEDVIVIYCAAFKSKARGVENIIGKG